MQYRPLGKSGLQVSEVGLGSNRLGEPYQSDRYWIELIETAVDLGVTLFDTAESYAKSRSEEMLGLALGKRDDIFVATKAKPMSVNGRGELTYTAPMMQKKVEESLRRLRRDVIDIYQLHSPSRTVLENSDWLDGMNSLRDQGKIRLRGVAIKSPEVGIWLIEQGAVDVLQVTYNIFETAVADELFALAEAQGVGLLGRMPIARGVLTGKFHPNEQVDEEHRAQRAGWRLSGMIEKAEDLRSLGDQYTGGMTRLAHHYSLTPEVVSAIIPGARTLDQLMENVAASNGVGLPMLEQKQIRRIQKKWSRAAFAQRVRSFLKRKLSPILPS